jgi:lipoprotein-anchoring transpeptidase ErfK/SrfK
MSGQSTEAVKFVTEELIRPGGVLFSGKQLTSALIARKISVSRKTAAMAQRVILVAVLFGSIVIGSLGISRAQSVPPLRQTLAPHPAATAAARPLVIGPADHILYINQPAPASTPPAARAAVPIAGATPPASSGTPTTAPEALKKAAAAGGAQPLPALKPAVQGVKPTDPKIGPADHILYIPARPVLKNAAGATVGGAVSHNPASSAAAANFGPSETSFAGPGFNGKSPGEIALLHTTDDSEMLPASWSAMIYKSRHELIVYYKGHFYKMYRAVFGRNLDHGAKVYAGDRRTPEGVYTIISKYRSSRFLWFLRLNYPNDVDWARFENFRSHHLISVSQVSSPGSLIGIHGTDEPLLNEADINWTTGCISVDNWAISELAALLPVGTLVIIKQ